MKSDFHDFKDYNRLDDNIKVLKSSINMAEKKDWFQHVYDAVESRLCVHVYGKAVTFFWGHTQTLL